ncbi:MAG: sodium:proton antiporter, partial [Gammaproteobacteria bacterium]
MSHSFAYAVVLVLGLGILAQWVAWRVRLPAIVLLALVGVIAGPVSGVLHPRQAFGDYLESIIGLCVAVILFEGGLNLAFHELKVAAAGVRRLVYLGVPLNWMGSAAAAHYVGGISWPVSWTFGAIVVVTGPTVIMPLLRQAVLNRRTASYLKWEGIINDPIGALLAVLVFQFLVFSGEGSPHGDVMLSLGKALLSAVALGGSAGYLAGQAFRRGFVPEYLKMPITLTLVLIVYVAGNLVQQEAGLLAVTIQGIVMGNMGLPSIQEMRRFKEYITIMLVSAVFILLTANLDPGTLQNLEWRALPLIVVLMVLVRPLAVWLATIGAGMDLRDRLLVGWVGPRGIVAAAVAGVFAPRLVAGGYPDGQVLVPVVFTLIMATVLLHGVSLSWLARRLGLAARARNRILIVGSSPWTTGLARLLQDLDQKVLIVDTSWHRLRHARLAGLSVYYGEILSDVAVESLELNDVGILLAATSNDAYNALVCTAFANELGRNSVF